MFHDFRNALMDPIAVSATPQSNNEITHINLLAIYHIAISIARALSWCPDKSELLIVTEPHQSNVAQTEVDGIGVRQPVLPNCR